MNDANASADVNAAAGGAAAAGVVADATAIVDADASTNRSANAEALADVHPVAKADADTLAHDFVTFAVEAGVLRFGDFTTKAGRLSPYFFNSALFDDGPKLARLAEFYARRLLAAGTAFDMLFGPAYKGITLAAATAMALAPLGRQVPFAFNRKEAKAHGEGGLLVGAPMRGRVVIVDDVITDGASKRESVEMIRAAGAAPAAVLIALDRMERGGADGNLSARSAVEDFEQAYAVPVIAIATLADLMQVLQSTADPVLAAHFGRVAAYRERYGVR